MDARQKHLAARVSSPAPAGIRRGEEHGLLARLYGAGDSWHNTSFEKSEVSVSRSTDVDALLHALHSVNRRETFNREWSVQKQPFCNRRRSEKGLDAAKGGGGDTNISKSNNESGRLDDTITPSMCGNAARIRATLVERLLSGIDRYGNRFSFET